MTKETFKLLVWRPEVSELNLSWKEIMCVEERIKGLLGPIPDFQPLADQLREYRLLQNHNILIHEQFKRKACYAKFAYKGRPAEFHNLQFCRVPFLPSGWRRRWSFVCQEWYLTLGWEFKHWWRHLEETLSLNKSAAMEFLKVHCPACSHVAFSVLDGEGNEWQSIAAIQRWLVVRGLDSEERDLITAIALYSGIFEADEIPKRLRREWPLLVENL